MFVMISCVIYDEDISCINYEDRIITCETDENKKQDQFCVDNEWINSGICYLCEDYDTRIVKCATDETMEQSQLCLYGDWINEDECLCPSDNPFCRKHAGLSWSNVTPWKTYDGTKQYCSELGGRIPSISELRTLIINCPATELGGECKIEPKCYSYDNCWDEETCGGCENDGDTKFSVFEKETLDSSTPDWDDDDNNWSVDFYDASIFSGKVQGDVSFRTRCVK